MLPSILRQNLLNVTKAVLSMIPKWLIWEVDRHTLDYTGLE